MAEICLSLPHFGWLLKFLFFIYLLVLIVHQGYKHRSELKLIWQSSCRYFPFSIASLHGRDICMQIKININISIRILACVNSLFWRSHDPFYWTNMFMPVVTLDFLLILASCTFAINNVWHFWNWKPWVFFLKTSTNTFVLLFVPIYKPNFLYKSCISTYIKVSVATAHLFL